MSRVKRGVTAHARHKKVLDMAKGYRGRNKNVFRVAIEKVEKGLQYAYRDRKNKKRSFCFSFFERQLFEFTLSCSFLLLLALNAGLFVVLSLAELGKHTCASHLTLEATQSYVERLVFTYFNYRHVPLTFD